MCMQALLPDGDRSRFRFHAEQAPINDIQRDRDVVILAFRTSVRLHSSSVEHGSSFAAKTQAICWCLYHRFRRVSRGEGVVRAGHVRPRAVQPRVGPGQRVARAGHDVVERGVLDPGAVERRDAVRAAEVFEVEQLRVRGAPRRATRIPARIPAQSASP